MIDLGQALASANGGDTIVLPPGTYAGISSKAAKAYSSPVTITAEDPASPPILTGSFNLANYDGLTFDGLKFELLAGVAFTALLRFYTCRNIAVRNCSFSGADYAGEAIMASGAGSVDGLEISGCTFRRLYRALVLGGVRNYSIIGNDIDDLKVDGMIFADASIGTIAQNLFGAFNTGPAHPDMIQFHSNGVPASTDVIIEDNLGLCDPAFRTQGIFIRGQYASDPTQRHKRFTIRRDVFGGTMWHGITPGQTDDLVLEDCSVFTIDAADGITSRIDLSNATGVSNRNSASKIIYPAAGIVSTGDNGSLPSASEIQLAAAKAQWLAKFRPDALTFPAVADWALRDA